MIAVKVRLQKEILMINELISKARQEGKYCIQLNCNEYSAATESLLKKAGYKVEYDFISWAHLCIAIEENEKNLEKVAKDSGVKILRVQ